MDSFAQHAADHHDGAAACEHHVVLVDGKPVVFFEPDDRMRVVFDNRTGPEDVSAAEYFARIYEGATIGRVGDG